MKKIVFMLFVVFGSVNIANAAHYVLVHGSWHGAWCWYEVETLLEKRGHHVTSVDLAAHGIERTSPEEVILQDYIDKVVSIIEEIETSEKVILVGHSMGGVVVTSVANQIPKRLDRLVYIAAFMLDHGQSMTEISRLDSGSMIHPGTLIPNLGGTVLDIDRSKVEEIFYNNTSFFNITLAERLLVPEPGSPINEEVEIDNDDYWKIKRFYVKTMYDNAISPEIQQMMIDRIGVDKVYPMYTDHSPFFSRPYHLIAILNHLRYQ